MGDTTEGTPLLEMSLAARTRALLARYDLRPVKGLGQSFLVDENLADKLARLALDERPETVLEIGAGLGALTVPLARAGIRVVAYEKDPKLEAPLRALLRGFAHVQLEIADFLEADLAPHAGPRTVAVGNLPYYVTSPMLEKLLLTRPSLGAIIVTVQREVAERLLAAPGTREYGSLTAFCAYHVRSLEQVARLGPEAFHPRPAVWSAAVRMAPRREPPEGVRSPTHFFAALRAAFGYRRKTLRRSLMTARETALDREGAEAVLSAAGIAPDRRGDTLDFEELIALGNALAAREDDA